MFEREKKYCEINPQEICTHCGECEFCDLDPSKICDNCGKCIQMQDCATLKIDGILPPEETPYTTK